MPPNETVTALLAKNKDKIQYIGLKNGKITQIRNILSNAKPNPEKLFVAEGIWAHMKILDAKVKNRVRVRSFLFCPECVRSPEAAGILEAMLGLCGDVYAVSERVFEKLSERDRIDGLLSLCLLPEYDLGGIAANLGGDAIVAVADGLEIPGNLGTIMRTCDGAGIDAVLLCNRRIRLTHPKFIKGSMGAAFAVPFAEAGSAGECMAWLKANGFALYLADTRAEKSYREYAYAGRTALIVGSEKYGISKEWYTPEARLLSIPMLGICDSLNVGVASSIILYEMSMRLRTSC
ncbi:MAG: RNA methyltransferase [Firmicutes bacterium]|nr:RNA methyltransferase [Bacillota bacterium]